MLSAFWCCTFSQGWPLEVLPLYVDAGVGSAMALAALLGSLGTLMLCLVRQ
jgi:hypothetical protein